MCEPMGEYVEWGCLPVLMATSVSCLEGKWKVISIKESMPGLPMWWTAHELEPWLLCVGACEKLWLPWDSYSFTTPQLVLLVHGVISGK